MVQIFAPAQQRVEPGTGGHQADAAAWLHGVDGGGQPFDQIIMCNAADGTPVHLKVPIRNVNRTVGTMLSHTLVKKWGEPALPDDTIWFKLTGSAAMATLFGVLGLLVWVAAPIVVSMKIFERQNL